LKLLGPVYRQAGTPGPFDRALGPEHVEGLPGHVPVKRDPSKLRRIFGKGWNFHGLETNVDNTVL